MRIEPVFEEILDENAFEAVPEGGSSLGIQMVAQELVSVVLGKEVIGPRLAGPSRLGRFEAVEGNPGRKGDLIGARGWKCPASTEANSPFQSRRSASSPESKARLSRSGYPTPIPR